MTETVKMEDFYVPCDVCGIELQIQLSPGDEVDPLGYQCEHCAQLQPLVTELRRIADALEARNES